MSSQPTLIQFKRADTTGVLAADGVLAHGEPAVDFATGTLYIGDGTNTPGLSFASTNSDASIHLIANTSGIGSSHTIVATHKAQVLSATGAGTAKMERLGYYDLGGVNPFTGNGLPIDATGLKSRWHWMAQEHVGPKNSVYMTTDTSTISMAHSIDSATTAYKMKSLSYDKDVLTASSNGKNFALVAYRNGTNNTLAFRQIGYTDLTGSITGISITSLTGGSKKMFYTDSAGDIQELTWSDSGSESGKALMQRGSTPQFQKILFSDITGDLDFNLTTAADTGALLYYSGSGTKWVANNYVRISTGASAFYGFVVEKPALAYSRTAIQFDSATGDTATFGLHQSGRPYIDCYNNDNKELRIFTTADPSEDDTNYSHRFTNKGALEISTVSETNSGADKISISINSPTYTITGTASTSDIPNYYSIKIGKVNFNNGLSTNGNTSKVFSGIYLEGSSIRADGGNKGLCPSYSVIRSTDNTSKGNVFGIYINSLIGGDSTTSSPNTFEHARGIYIGTIKSESKASGYARGIDIDSIKSDLYGSTGGARGVSIGTIRSDKDSYGMSIDILDGSGTLSGFNISSLNNDGTHVTYGFNVNAMTQTRTGGSYSSNIITGFRVGSVSSISHPAYGMYVNNIKVTDTNASGSPACGIHITDINSQGSGAKTAGLYIGMNSGNKVQDSSSDNGVKYSIITDHGLHYFGDLAGESALFSGNVTIKTGRQLTIGGTSDGTGMIISNGNLKMSNGVVEQDAYNAGLPVDWLQYNTGTDWLAQSQKARNRVISLTSNATGHSIYRIYPGYDGQIITLSLIPSGSATIADKANFVVKIYGGDISTSQSTGNKSNIILPHLEDNVNDDNDYIELKWFKPLSFIYRKSAGTTTKTWMTSGGFSTADAQGAWFYCGGGEESNFIKV